MRKVQTKTLIPAVGVRQQMAHNTNAPRTARYVTRQIQADGYGPLAVGLCHAMGQPSWGVLHVQTGLYVASFACRANAIGCLYDLLALDLDWGIPACPVEKSTTLTALWEQSLPVRNVWKRRDGQHPDPEVRSCG
jgi:hypothetical protein